MEHAKDENIEKGRKARINCTVVESNIHKPFDSVKAEALLGKCQTSIVVFELLNDIKHYGDLAKQVYE